MVQPKLPTRRTGKHLENANLILENWRFKTVRTKYTPGPFTFASFLPETVLKTLASHSNIQSVHDMKISVKWIFADKHGDEILALLRDLDKSERQDREAGVLKRREDRKAATAAKREAEKRIKEQEREQKKREKEAERLAEAQQKRSKVAARANAKVQASAVAKPPTKRTRREPLHGTSVLNLTPTTPMPVPHVRHLPCIILRQGIDSVN
jgi:bloom syndrome protein